MNSYLETVSQIPSTVIDLVIKFRPKAFVAIVILAVGFFVGRWMGCGSERLFRKMQLEAPIRMGLVRAVRILSNAA